MCNVSKVFNVVIITGLLMAAITGCAASSQQDNPVDSQQWDNTEEEAADQGFSPLDSDWSELDTSQIESVSLYPYRTTDEPVVLSEEDVTELVNLLNEVELSGEGESITMSSRGTHTGMFHIELTDGTMFDFAAISPYSYYINFELRFLAKREISYEIQDFYLDLNKKYYCILQQQDSDEQGFLLFDIDLSQLDVSQIESVRLYPYRVMDEPVTLLAEDVTELVNLLNEVEFLGEGRPIKMLKSGDRTGMFHIELTDGTIFEFASSSPDAYYINLELQFYTEDAVSYEISQFYFAMLGKYYDLSPQSDVTGEEASDQGFSPLDFAWEELDISQIESVSLYPYQTADEPVILSEEDVYELVDLLNKVKLYGEGYQVSDTTLASGDLTGMFHIELTGETSFEFAAIPPNYYYIDFDIQFYATEEIAYEISQLYFALLGEYYGFSQQPGVIGDENTDQECSVPDIDWAQLDTSQIEFISLYPVRVMDEPAVLSEEDVSELVELLKEVKLSERGYPITEFPNGARPGMFHIELTDGTAFEFSASTPAYYINLKIWFYAEDDVSYKISQFYSAMLRKYYDL